MERVKTIDFDELVVNLKSMYEKIGSLSYYIFAIKYGNSLKGQNLSEIVRAANLTESMSKELSKGLRIYDILSKNDFGIALKNEDDNKWHNPIDDKSVSLSDLADILYRMEADKKEYGIGATATAFGFKYGKAITTGGYTCGAIIDEAKNRHPDFDLTHTHNATIKYGVDLCQMLENHAFGLLSPKMSSVDANTSIKLCDIKGNLSLQQIYYGAPGTGKSYEINEKTKGCSVIRTTFHPDSDYSTFVGAYKPTMGKGKVYGAQGPVKDENNNVIEEERITYTFIKQAFLKAYLSAWKKYTENDESSVEPQFLVIEEINRGNCAQIFGDLFQLLDRSDNGFSTYPIEADADLQNEIKKAFAEEYEFKLSQDIAVDSAVKNYASNYGKTLSDDIQNGRILLLPPNLCIWATMNTSDQSLFPIDSAFKRRWEWRYVKIGNGYKRDEYGSFVRDADGKRVPLGWTIRCGETNTDWWQFIQAINNHIGEATSSDDKKLGYFFCKPKKGEDFIGEEAFVGKVIFYLWNDVFKDNDTSLFKLDNSNREPSFDEFYTEDEDGNTIANQEAISKFICNVLGKEYKSQDDTNE